VDLVYEQVVFHEGQVPDDGDLFASHLVRGAATKPSDCGPEGILPFPGRRGS